MNINGEREAFISWIFNKRRKYIVEICQIQKNIKDKQAKLNLILEKAKTKKEKDKIKEQLKMFDDELLKIKKELQGDTLKRVIQKLEEMPKITEISYGNKGIIIKTNDIMCGGKYNYGKYLIVIKDDGILIEREDKFEYDGKCHPFVSNNVPCYGIWNPTIKKAIENGGIYTIIIATLKLLECNKYYDAWYISPAEFYAEIKNR